MSTVEFVSTLLYIGAEMAAGAASEESERRRDKLSLRIRREGKIVGDSHQLLANVEKDQRNSYEVPLVPATSRSHDQSYAQSDNRWIYAKF